MKTGDFVIYDNPYNYVSYIVQLDYTYNDMGEKMWEADNEHDHFFDIFHRDIRPIELPFLVREYHDENTIDGKVISIDYEKKTCVVQDGISSIPIEREWFNNEAEYIEYMEYHQREKHNNTTEVSLWDIRPLITSGKAHE